MSRIRTAWIVVAGLALIPGMARAGAAGSLTGNWYIEFRCRGAVAASPDQQVLYVKEYYLPIQQVGDSQLVQAGDGETGAQEGLVVFDATRPGRFQLSLASCDLGSPLYGLSLHVRGRVDDAGAKAKGSAVLLYEAAEFVGACKVKLERVAPNPSGPPWVCP